jgi:23S rRNA pseudouridine2605 synthase
MRVSKILAQAGLASRRGAEALLEAGRVTINGVVRREPGAQADPATDTIALDGRPVGAREAHAYVLLHKPPGYVTSLRDPEGRRVVTDLVPAGMPRVFPVGRLDYDAEGLLLLTNDGDLANRLLHPRYEIPRVYEAEVERHVGPRDLDRWRRGVTLPDGPAVPSAIRILSHGKASTWLSVTFREGRYREVKRYCKALGHPVMRLRRVQFGPLHLGTLPLGRTRALTAGELERLQNLLDPGGSPILPGIRR